VVPRIIGKGGETIKKLTHGKPLYLEVDRTTGQIVLGATTPEGRDALLAEVKEIIAENCIMRIPGDPAMMKAQYREFGRSKSKAELQDLVWFDIDEDKHVFIIRGKEEDLVKAKGVLEEFLINNSMDEFAILDEDFDVLLTGGKTSKIMTMSEELNVNLSADRSKSIISIRGPSDKVAQAKKTLALFLHGGDGQSVAKIAVSEQLVGTIIGKGGKTRKDLEAKYSPVSIHVSKTYKVSIRGPQDKVNECRIEILKMIAAARVTQTVPLDSEQEAKLEKNDALKRITQQSHCQLTVADHNVSVRGFFYDVRDAVSLLNEQLTGEYKSSVELSPSQYARVSSACRDSSHFQRIELATDTKVALESSSGEIQVCGKRSSVKKGKEQVYDFLSFICPGEIQRLKISQPLYVTVGNPSSLADVVANVGGTTIYLDRDISSIIIRDPDVDRVKAAADIVLTKIQDAERLAFVLEIAPDEAWLISYIIGKNGGRIQSLQKGSDCHIDVSKESRTITITGDSEEKVDKVRQSLEALVEQARRENVFLTIPEKAIPAFVGHGGKRIKDWSTEFGVEIQRVRKSTQFKIIGEGDKATSAKAALAQWVEQWQEANASHEMTVEKQYISAILGLKGSTAQAIQEEFDCKIDIDRTTMKLTIRGGDAEKREAALARIQDIIAKEAAAKAQAAAERKAERKEAASEKAKEASESAATTDPIDHKKENKRENPGNARSFPSHPVGLKPSGKNQKKAKDNVTSSGGTEQGRNLFNLLIEG
jgi:rRNA processing protein Krr1/Pno1